MVGMNTVNAQASAQASAQTYPLMRAPWPYSLRFVVKVTGFALHRGTRCDGEYDGGHTLASARAEARWFRDRLEGGTVTIHYVVPVMGDLRAVEVVS